MKESPQRGIGQEKFNASNKIVSQLFYCFTVTCEINADKKYTLSGRTSN